MLDDQGPDRLRRFVHGDRDAFEILFRHFEPDVYRWIVRIVRDRGRADANSGSIRSSNTAAVARHIRVISAS